MKRIFPALLFASFLISPPSVHAVCPVCTVAVVAGLGLSRWLGIDDSASGVWIGGLILSSALWLASWLRRKNVILPFLEFWSVLLMYIMVIVPFYAGNIIGHPRNTIWGLDKLVVGIAAGSALFLIGVFLDKFTRNMHGGKILFYYQKVVFPVSLLVAGSGVFYLITRH